MLFLVTSTFEDFPVDIRKYYVAALKQFLNFLIPDTIVNVLTIPAIFQQTALKKATEVVRDIGLALPCLLHDFSYPLLSIPETF